MTIQYSTIKLFHLSYMAVSSIHFKMKIWKVEKDVHQKQIIKYDMHVSSLFVICIIIKDNDRQSYFIDNTTQSNLFHL